MTDWKPLSAFPEFTSVAAAPGMMPAPDDALASSVRSGLPWENRATGNFFSAFADTLMMVLTGPTRAFSVMRREGGIGNPLAYAVIGGSAGAIVSALFSMGLQSLGLFANQQNAVKMMAGLGVGSVVLIILMPLLVTIGTFIGSAIVHLCLMIVGGANQSFETTFRVMAFTHGSTGVVQMIPLCGGLIAGIWGLIVSCIGLARAHDTSVGKAIFAILLPGIICCGTIFILIVFFGVGAAMLHHNQ